MSLYLYALVPAPGPGAALSLSGVGGCPVEAVTVGRVSALTSPVADGRVRPSRVNLQAHEAVVSAAHDAGPALPVRFGTVLPDGSTLRREILERRAEDFEALMEDLRDMDEYRVRATYLPDVALREAVAANRRIRALRDRGRTQADRIELGEIVFAELTRIREDDSARLITTLGKVAAACEEIPARSDEVAASFALLVGRAQRAELQKAVERVAETQRERLRVELVGPLPPWDFCDIALEVA